MLKLKCAGCGAKFSRRTRGRCRKQYCTRLCANKTNGKLAGLASFRLGASRRTQLDQPHDHRLIPVRLKSGEIISTAVDIEDYESLATYNWRLSWNGYVIARSNLIRIHRLVAARKLGRALNPNERVDHRDRNPLNNRRYNLRLATNSQNASNTIHRRTAEYRGITKIQTKSLGVRWRTQIRKDGQIIRIGTFGTSIEAAYIYDQFALQLFGEFAVLNFLGQDQ